MLSDTQIRSLKIEDGKRHADRDGLVLEPRPSKKKLNKVFIFRFQWDKKLEISTKDLIEAAKIYQQIMQGS